MEEKKEKTQLEDYQERVEKLKKDEQFLAQKIMSDSVTLNQIQGAIIVLNELIEKEKLKKK